MGTKDTIFYALSLPLVQILFLISMLILIHKSSIEPAKILTQNTIY